jgi:O-antigen/teichoic acid export membrane protein
MNLPRIRALPAAIHSELGRHPTLRATLANTGWLFAERFIFLVAGFLVTAWVIRYLGPEQFGLFSYVTSLVALFAVFATLGLNEILVRGLVRGDARVGELLATSLSLRLVAALSTAAVVIVIGWSINPDPLTRLLLLVVAATLLFQPAEVLGVWFEARVRSRYVVWARTITLAVGSLLRVTLILLGMPLIWFAVTLLVESAVLAAMLVLLFRWRGKTETNPISVPDDYPLPPLPERGDDRRSSPRGPQRTSVSVKSPLGRGFRGGFPFRSLRTRLRGVSPFPSSGRRTGKSEPVETHSADTANEAPAAAPATSGEWRPRLSVARALLRDGWPLMLASFAVLIYMKIDQIMLKEMAGATAVGTYAAAVRLSELAYFIPVALGTSLFPAIVRSRQNHSERTYRARMQAFYDLMATVAYLVVLPLVLLAPWLVGLLFGSGYEASTGIFQIHIWAFLFVSLGVARGKWLVAENMVRFSLLTTLLGAVTNVALNLWLIPRYGGLGAAWATLASQAVAAYLSCALLPRLWPLLGQLTLSLLVPLRLPSLIRALPEVVSSR